MLFSLDSRFQSPSDSVSSFPSQQKTGGPTHLGRFFVGVGCCPKEIPPDKAAPAGPVPVPAALAEFLGEEPSAAALRGAARPWATVADAESPPETPESGVKGRGSLGSSALKKKRSTMKQQKIGLGPFCREICGKMCCQAVILCCQVPHGVFLLIHWEQEAHSIQTLLVLASFYHSHLFTGVLYAPWPPDFDDRPPTPTPEDANQMDVARPLAPPVEIPRRPVEIPSEAQVGSVSFKTGTSGPVSRSFQGAKLKLNSQTFYSTYDHLSLFGFANWSSRQSLCPSQTASILQNRCIIMAGSFCRCRSIWTERERLH